MADFTTIKTEIDANIVPFNDAQEITGEKINTTLKDLVDSVNAKKSDPVTISQNTQTGKTSIQVGGGTAVDVANGSIVADVADIINKIGQETDNEYTAAELLTISGYYLSAAGAVVRDSSATPRYAISEKIKVSSGDKFTIKVNMIAIIPVLVGYDSNDAFVESIVPTATYSTKSYEYIVGGSVKYIRLAGSIQYFTTYKVTKSPFGIEKDIKDIKAQITEIKGTALFKGRKYLSNNIVDPTQIEEGFYYAWNTGVKTSRADIASTGLIPCEKGITYCAARGESTKNGGNITYWDKNGLYLSGADNSSGVFTIPDNEQIAYFRISFYKAYKSSYRICVGSEVKPYDDYNALIGYIAEEPVYAPNIGSDSVVFADFIKNKTIEYLYDETTNANYSLIRINKEHFDGTIHKPIVVHSTPSTTAKLLNARMEYNCVINAGIFGTSGADGILIIDGEVVKNAQSSVHPQCKPLTIDEYGDLGAAAYDVDAYTLVSQGIKYAVCGFMPIIINFEAVPESEWNEVEHYYQNAQRQIIGQFDNGDYGILTSEGRGSANSDGWTIAEAQSICIKHGLKFAYNLDGGGSTELVVGKKMLNHIYEGSSGRLVPTFICF